MEIDLVTETEEHTKIFFLRQDPCKSKDGRYKFNHGPFILDTDSRTIECKTCKKNIDLFEALLAYANMESRWFNKLENLRVQLGKTEATLETKRRCKCEFCGKMTWIGRAPANLQAIKP